LLDWVNVFFINFVQLLLTIIASNNVEVHGETLLLIIKTCFNIHLFSREDVTEQTASGSLVQMINRILARMEEQPEVRILK
jgi:brefeldin A-inhibited guanine nucleotide-exchange protein